MPSDKKSKKSSKGWKIHPDSDEDHLVNNVYEMADKENNKYQKVAKDKLMYAAQKAVTQNNAIQLIANIKAGASRWRRYATTRRKGTSEGSDGVDRRKTGGIGLDFEISLTQDDVDGKAISDKTHREMVIACNRNLIEYFARLGQSKDQNDCINLEYVESLLNNGAKVDCTDKYGQTVFHEVARAWHTDVAQFLLDHKANINQADNYGRTPLHVAAAVDYPEMVTFLIENGADKEARTKGENQTPVHFAARNDACSSLKALIKCGAQYQDVRDYKKRTPLHVAAELDRSETARMLLELDEPASAGVEDDSGQSAIVWMVKKMPPVAKLALDQFHTTDRANRKQYYHLHKLEPQKPGVDMGDNCPESALQVMIRHRRYDLVIHSAIDRLISLKWRKHGLLGASLNTIVNLVFILLWTVQGILVEYDKRHIYELPDQWWRILLFILALLATIWQLKEELSEFFLSRKNHQRWCLWREKEIKRDLEYAHPRWPEEETYLKCEIQELDKMRPQYFNDFWNIFDWICYALLTTCVITHLVDVFSHTHFIARLHIQIMAITIILIWLRLMKNARAFSTLGPFIVMLGHMLGDILKFACLYMEFYIPYACAFWMLFGGDKVPKEYQGRPDANNHTVIVSGYQDTSALLFSLFRLTLVDDYDYDGMKEVDPVMADILVGTWLALSAIVMLNLFIALMADTFVRVYDNAKANSVMQKAITILNIEEGMSNKRRENFRKYIHEKCAPEEAFYDDDTLEDGGDDLKKVTFQIKDQLDALEEALRDGQINMGIHGDSDEEMAAELLEGGDGPGPDDDRRPPAPNKGKRVQVVTAQKFDREVTTLKDQLRDQLQYMREQQDKMRRDMSTMKSLMKRMVVSQMGAIDPATPEISAINLGPSSFVHNDLTSNMVDEGYSSRLHRVPSLQGQPATGTASQLALYQPPEPLEAVWTRSRTQLGKRRESTLQATSRKTGSEALLESDDEWEKSERKRKQDLQDLRRELTMKASAPVKEDVVAEEADVLTIDPSLHGPKSSVDGHLESSEDVSHVPRLRIKQNFTKTDAQENETAFDAIDSATNPSSEC